MIGFSAEVGEGDFRLSDELVEARWFNADEAKEKLRNTSVGNILFEEIIAQESKKND